MKIRLKPVIVLVLLGFSFFAGACSNNKTTESGGQPTPPSRTIPVSAPMTLNIVLAGPFAIVEHADGIVVYLPTIEDHNPPTAITSGDLAHIRTLQPGDYDFTKGVEGNAGSIVPLIPVPDTAVFKVSAAAEHLPQPPREKPYLSIKLPVPREIVPWNADPLQISDQSPVPPNTPSARYATVTILRFDAQPSDAPELDGPNGYTWKPIATPLGTERIVTIAVEPVQEDDQHTHARNAFKHLTHLLGLKRYTEFPHLPVGYIRNIPLTPNALPSQLVAALPGDRGRLNDCKAASVLVEP